MSEQTPSDKQAPSSSEQQLPKAKDGMPSMRTADGRDVAVPPEGSLGLLAMGYKGVMLWREARAKSGWSAKQAGAQAREIAKAQEAKRKETQERIKAARVAPDQGAEPSNPNTK